MTTTRLAGMNTLAVTDTTVYKPGFHLEKKNVWGEVFLKIVWRHKKFLGYSLLHNSELLHHAHFVLLLVFFLHVLSLEITYALSIL